MRCQQDHCSVVNLRIPFGKVEEWDVPQRVRDKEEGRSDGHGVEKKSAGNSGMKYMCGDGDESDEMDIEKSSRLRMFDLLFC